MSNPAEVVQSLRNAFDSGKTKPLAFREKQLKQLLRLYEENHEAIIAVLAKDLHKCRMETIVTEVNYLINDLKLLISKFYEWAQPEYPPKALANILDKLCIYNDPYGVVLVIGSWNYPIQLTLLPVAGAIAAGNCVLIKPSEVSSNCSRFIAQTIPKYIDNECYKVFEGGIPETTALLKERFDYIFYTGSTQVGKIIHQAANKYLTPVTLELGGKSPVYLDKSADIKVATKRILWGKYLNAGQTCVAPDYLICSKEVQQKFIETAKNVIKEFFGEDPKKSPDYGRIINQRQFERILNLIKGSKIVIGGDSDISELYIAPTVIADAQPNDPIMQDEIFGPILPIIPLENAYEAIKFIKSREKPLAFYIFSNNKRDVDLLIDNTSSGGVCVNDVIMHMATDLPFGGVGSSGMGSYHAKYTFDTFTHKKSCLHKDLGFIGESLGGARYPPYNNNKLRLLNLLLKRRSGIPCKYLGYFIVFGLGFFASFGVKAVLNYYGIKEYPLYK